jgi:hypothetical protein
MEYIVNALIDIRNIARTICWRTGDLWKSCEYFVVMGILTFSSRWKIPRLVGDFSFLQRSGRPAFAGPVALRPSITRGLPFSEEIYPVD